MTATAEVATLPYQVNQSVKPMSVEGLSEKLLDQHWKLYEGYVSNVNLLSEAIRKAAQPGSELNKPSLSEMQRRFGFEYNGMVLHEYYFAGLKKAIMEPSHSSSFASTAAASHGSFEGWKKQFMEIGRMRGVGWAIAYLDPFARRLVNVWISDHETGHIAGFIPIVVMDCWEHAYVLDYGAAGRDEYVRTYFRNLHWGIVEERIESALEGKEISRVAA